MRKKFQQFMNNNHLINTIFVAEMWEQLFKTLFILNFIDIYGES